MLKHNSRYPARIAPNLRSLRTSIGLTVQEAAGILGEQAALVHDQEAATYPSPDFSQAAATMYLAHAVVEAKHGRFPTMSDIRGATTLDWLRRGLGLEVSDIRAILRASHWQCERLLDGASPLPEGIRRAAWLTAADWARRRLRRLERHRELVERLAAARGPIAGMTARQVAEMELAAATGRRAGLETEMDALRLLGADPYNAIRRRTAG